MRYEPRTKKELVKKYEMYSRAINFLQKVNQGKIPKRGTEEGELRHRYFKALKAVEGLYLNPPYHKGSHPPSKSVLESWEIGRHLMLGYPNLGDLVFVGKENGEIQLARDKHGKNGIKYSISSYKPENVLISGWGGPIVKAIPERRITSISMDEYYQRLTPLSLENAHFLEIMHSHLI